MKPPWQQTQNAFASAASSAAAAAAATGGTARTPSSPATSTSAASTAATSGSTTRRSAAAAATASAAAAAASAGNGCAGKGEAKRNEDASNADGGVSGQEGNGATQPFAEPQNDPPGKWQGQFAGASADEDGTWVAAVWARAEAAAVAAAVADGAAAAAADAAAAEVDCGSGSAARTGVASGGLGAAAVAAGRWVAWGSSAAVHPWRTGRPRAGPAWWSAFCRRSVFPGCGPLPAVTAVGYPSLRRTTWACRTGQSWRVSSWCGGRAMRGNENGNKSNESITILWRKGERQRARRELEAWQSELTQIWRVDTVEEFGWNNSMLHSFHLQSCSCSWRRTWAYNLSLIELKIEFHWKSIFSHIVSRQIASRNDIFEVKRL